jgi:asparagine synthase (glutamine-hydrolysing)
MCGIWGTVGTADEQMAEVAARAMQHRGPDDHGVYVAHEPVPVALVNTRLSIIDLTDAGHQPMCTEDGRYWIVHNGEIYNFEALREVLIELGHRFFSRSDTEVALYAYKEWGDKCLDNLRGMFAFAIWDAQEAKLFAARDRLGIKPLYYIHRPGHGSFAFASELKALLTAGLAERRLSYAALHHYLSFYSVPTPYTMLEGVEALPAGHFLTFQDGKLNTRPYWSLPAIEPHTLGEDEILAELRRLLEESIRLHMIADVPVGAFLSGGLDSSAVVALMTRIGGARLRSFSIGFGAEGQAIDERSQARTLAEYYGTDHTEVIVSGRSVRDQIDRIILAMDQPTGDGLNTYLVSQATGQQGKVALSGLGGDELFAGYPQFRLFKRADRASDLWRRLPRAAREVTRGTAPLSGSIQRALTWLDGDLLTRYERVRVLFDEERKLGLYTPATVSMLVAPESSLKYLGHFVHPAETEPIPQLTRLELLNYMAHTLLRDTDAMSMAHSLEVRVPLIDHKLVEFAARIPGDLKLREGRSKWIFAQALQDVLPEEVLDRPKHGFEMPVAAWMRRELRDVLDDVLSRESIERRGVFRYEAVQDVYRDFLEHDAPYMYTWALAVLELWMRTFIDQGMDGDAWGG